MDLKRNRHLSRSSHYTIFTGAPSRGELQGWLSAGDDNNARSTLLLWEKVSSDITFPRQLLPPLSPPSSSFTPSESSLHPPNSQPQHTTRTTSPFIAPPPPPPSRRVDPTPSPQKGSLPSGPSPVSSTDVPGSFSQTTEVSGPPSGRKGTRDRGPEWTPILTTPSFEESPGTKRRKADSGAGGLIGRALAGKGAKGLLSLVAEDGEGEEEARGTNMTATNATFLAPSPFIPPARAPPREQEDCDRGEVPSRSRGFAGTSIQDPSLISTSSTRPPSAASGYDNVLTQYEDSDTSRSRFEDPNETAFSVEESPSREKGKGRTSIAAPPSRSTRSRSQLANTTSADFSLLAGAEEDSQDSFGSSYLQTQPSSQPLLVRPTTTAATKGTPFIHPKINPSDLIYLDSPLLSLSASQLPSRINFLAVVLSVSLDSFGKASDRFWTVGKITVHDGRMERVIECWEETASEWCGGEGRGRLRALDVVWFQKMQPALERSSKYNKTPKGPLSVLFKPVQHSSFTVFYRCSELIPDDAPEDLSKWRVDLSVRNTGVERVRKLKELVEEGMFGS